MSLFKLFLIFTKIGAILLGGGYVILPILTDELCEKRKLLTNEELVDYFALSQSLPGIIAANISMFAGYKLNGIKGAITAVIGVTFIPFWTIVFLASFLDRLVNNNFVQSAMWGVGIAVIALITLTIREIWQKSDKDKFFYFIFILSLVSMLYFELSPIQTIIIFSVIGILIKRSVKKA